MSVIYKIRNVKTKEFLDHKSGSFSKKAGSTFKQLSKAKENLDFFKDYDFRMLDKSKVTLELVKYELIETVM